MKNHHEKNQFRETCKLPEQSETKGLQHIAKGTIQFVDFSFRYETAQDYFLQNITCQIERGEFCLLAGPTGSGKTTLIRSLNGLVPYFYTGEFCGYVYVDGNDTMETKTIELAQTVGMVFQNPENQLVALTVEREIAFGLENLGVPREEMHEKIKKIIKELNIEHLMERAPYTLSGGEMQQVALASILVLEPSILVMDEPTSSLDPASALKIMNVLKEIHTRLNMTIIIIEHRIELMLPYIDSILLLSNGRLLAHDKKDIIMQQDVFYGLGLNIPGILKLIYQWNKENEKEDAIPIAPQNIGKWIKNKLQEKEIIITETDLSELSLPSKKQELGQPLGLLNDVFFDYNELEQGERSILYRINLSFQKGEILGILGQNGAGKSTLLRLLNGLLKPNQGDVYISRRNTKDWVLTKLTKKVGLVFQKSEAQLFASSVQEELSFSLENLKLSKPEQDEWEKEIIDRLALESFLDKSPFILSGGQRKKVSLASILCRKPSVLLFDEPTTGQDQKEVEI